jgi:quercetin dioxygenase-like cupin family protein
MQTSNLLFASTLVACTTGHAAPGAPALPATATDPDKYRVVLDNERVRVLDYTDHPGDRTSLHHHPDFVLHALGPFERKLIFPDGTSRVVSFHGGETVFMPAQTHAGENVGKTDTHVLIVELKAPR